MKVEVDIRGVEQSVDFETMKANQFVVLTVFGIELRVQISEEQLEELTQAAVNEKVAPPTPDEAWDETREVSDDPPDDRVSEPMPVRDFQYSGVMGGLTEQTDDIQPGETVNSFFENESAKAEQLRARKPQRRTVPRDEAGNPVAEQRALPRVSGFTPESDDDGFFQG